jgi:hypothetical protein
MDENDIRFRDPAPMNPHVRLDHTFFEDEVRPHLGALLLETRLITPQQLDQALEVQRGSGKRLGQVVVELGWLFEQDIARALALQNGLEYIDLEATSVDRRAAVRMNPETGKSLCAIPVRYQDGGLLVAVADPYDAPIVTLVAETGARVAQAIGERTLILAAWSRLLRGQQP